MSCNQRRLTRKLIEGVAKGVSKSDVAAVKAAEQGELLMISDVCVFGSMCSWD